MLRYITYMWKLTKEQKDIICKQYQTGISSTVLAKQYDVSWTAVLAIIKRRGIHIRSPREAQIKHSMNESVFDEINEQAAYWIGFLMGDGTIVRRSGSPELALVLSSVDLEHLLAFRDFLESSHAITFIPFNGYTNAQAHKFSIRSAKLVDALARYGVSMRKTQGAKAMNIENNRHFWRGLLDADGWFGLNSKGQTRLDIVGTKNLLEQLASFNQTINPKCRANVRPHKSIWAFGLCGSFAAKLLSCLYDNSTISLKRKHNKYLSLTTTLH